MRIVDTSNGPAIDDDGYIILPTDRAGILHLATLDPNMVNDLLDSISRYISEGLADFKKYVRLNAAGELSVPFSDIEDISHNLSKANSASALMAQVSRFLLQELSVGSDTPDSNAVVEQPAPSFPPGYEIVVYPAASADGVPTPGLYYPSFDVIPQKVLDGIQSGEYSLYHWEGAETGSVQMSYDEVMAAVQA